MIINDPNLRVGDHVKVLGGEWHLVTARDVEETRAARRAAEEAAACKSPDPYAKALAELRASEAPVHPHRASRRNTKRNGAPPSRPSMPARRRADEHRHAQKQRRDGAQAALDACVQQALLGATVTS